MEGAKADGGIRDTGAERAGAQRGKRIVLATFGSFGDLHPYIALGLGLKARGHTPVLATSEFYRAKVEGEGLGFHPVRPELPPESEARELVAKIMDPKGGQEFLLRKFLMPRIREQCEDLLAAARGADLLLSHPITYGAPLAAEKLGLLWVATALQPLIFISAYDPPVPPEHPWLIRLAALGPKVMGALLRMGKDRFRPWAEPVERLRAELGLPPAGHPMFEGQFSPYLNLALFSRVLGEPQPDWPAHTRITGFPFYDRLEPGKGLSPELAAFLKAGPPPVVFTLGSSAVAVARDFYLESAEACRRLGRRGVLLVGREGWNRLPDPLPEGVFACDYAPHSELFLRSAAIVHQGGVGTTGQALRSGRPMLVVPFAHDQPDNAYRVTRLGVGRSLSRARYTAGRAAEELRRLLEDPAYARRAEEAGRRVRAEDGVSTACDAIEGLLRKAGGRRSG